MDSTCAENARPREALADIPAESSRGDCGGGFLTVPALSFGILYCFFIISHDRRRIVHYHVTRNPNALWVGLQLRQAWECGEQPPLFLIFA